MLEQTIRILSNDFLNEARSSPQLLADMAAMESYMAESYCGRAFVELLQNADDCDSSNILVRQFGTDLLVANNGHPFNEKDVIAISRSGASTKERGKNIGYRGIGFKSTIYLSNEIVIYSDNTYFTFSKDLCAKKLNTDINNVPTIRIPLLYKPDNELENAIESLTENGYTTVFIFKNANIEEFVEELKSVENDCFLFLKNVCGCIIETDLLTKDFYIERTNTENYQIVSFCNDIAYQWIVFSDSQASVGFKYSKEENAIIACKENEQLYHSYLPTYDKVLYPVKINADFSTDPSRKHITIDSKSEKAIGNIATLLYYLIQRAFDGNNINGLKNIFLIFNKTMGFSRINSILKKKFFELINEKCHITTNQGNVIPIYEYKLFPDWFESSEIALFRKNSKYVIENSLPARYYDWFIALDEFIGKFSQVFYTNEELMEIMKDYAVVKLLAPETQGKILGKILKKEKLMQEMYHKGPIDLTQIKILSNNGVVSIDDFSNSDMRIESKVFDSLTNNLGADGVEWFLNISKIKTNVINNESIDSSKELKVSTEERITTIKPHISKWRSAEQQCIEIERLWGNNAIDVSKRNVGYDVESCTSNGEKRYIEVKSIKELGEFSITNNEYTAAHQYGDEYYLCLMVQNDNKVKVTYINNPLKNLNFEKRIRQWEWVCDSYSGENFEFEY